MKKIRLDFSTVEDKPAWNTRKIPEGMYKAKIVSVTQTEAQDGTPMLVYGFRLVNSQYASRLFPYYCKLQQNQLWKLRDLLIAGGLSVPKKAQQIDPQKIVGSIVAVDICDDSYNGTVHSIVANVYQANLIDDTDDTDIDDDEIEIDDTDDDIDVDDSDEIEVDDDFDFDIE